VSAETPSRPAGRRRRNRRAATTRQIAARVLDEALASLLPVDRRIERAGAGLDERDRRLLSELVYGGLRWLRRLDHVIAAAAGRKLREIDPQLLAPLRLGVLQLVALDRVPAHAAVSEAVDEARARSGRAAAGFVNAVLRRVAGAPGFEAWPVDEADPVRRLAIEQSHRELQVRRWWNRFGEARTRAIVAANNGPRALHLLTFRDRGSRAALAEELRTEKVETRASQLSSVGLIVERGDPLRSAAFGRGDLYIQDVASQAAACVPMPRAGERILDAAAAPGGKGLALLAMQPGASVVFADSNPWRARLLRENLRRLGRPRTIVVADAGAPPYAERFERIVLDAPCSGTGTLRRHPELRWRFRAEEVERLAKESERLLHRLLAALAPGGMLILLTCSIEGEENEEVIARLLANEPELERRRLEPGECPPADDLDEAAGCWRVFPGSEGDGFTAHVLQRSGARTKSRERLY